MIFYTTFKRLLAEAIDTNDRKTGLLGMSKSKSFKHKWKSANLYLDKHDIKFYDADSWDMHWRYKFSDHTIYYWDQDIAYTPTWDNDVLQDLKARLEHNGYEVKNIKRMLNYTNDDRINQNFMDAHDK